MGTAGKRLERRKQARAKLSDLVAKQHKVLIIHYSCESFYDQPPDASPRITCIAVRSLDTNQTESFSIQNMALKRRLSADAIEAQYDALERKMLDAFYKHVQGRLQQTWLHWNMRNRQYGFSAIAHRYEVLGGKPTAIPDENMVDLSQLLEDAYGPRYAPHRRLTKIALKNGLSHQDFLEGSEEAQSFVDKSYGRLQGSTLRKVDTLVSLVRLAADDTLKTYARFYSIRDVPQLIAEMLVEKWYFVIPTIIATWAALFIGIIPYIQQHHI